MVSLAFHWNVSLDKYNSLDFMLSLINLSRFLKKKTLKNLVFQQYFTLFLPNYCINSIRTKILSGNAHTSSNIWCEFQFCWVKIMFVVAFERKLKSFVPYEKTQKLDGAWYPFRVYKLVYRYRKVSDCLSDVSQEILSSTIN